MNLPISVVIIAKNAQATIKNCLEAVAKNDPAEIVVVDGMSKDRTVEISKNYTDKIFSDEGRGPAYARQLGAEKATSEYIAFVDSDVVLQNNTLTVMFTELQQTDFAVINARIGQPSKDYTYWERVQWWQHQRTEERNREGHLATMACLLKRELVLRYGFNPEGGTIDDIDLEYKLVKAGYKLGMSATVVDHCWIRTASGTIRRRFTIGRMKPHAMKHYGPWRAGYWAPVTSVYWLTSCIVKGKLGYIPFFLLDGIVQTCGMIAGFIDIVRGKTL